MFKKMEGRKVPEATFRTRVDHEWRELSSKDVFSGKNVIVFSLPGAFTPTCSSSHVPRFNQLAPVFKAHGIDDIICMSVNDAFVMGAWGEAQNVEGQVRMVADGSAAFTKAVGLELDLTERGLGLRSERYAMIIDDGVVTALHREAPGKFEVSSAEAMLAEL